MITHTFTHTAHLASQTHPPTNSPHHLPPPHKMTAGIIHPLSSDPYALAMAAVWKKSIDLGVPLEFLMIESMGPWSSDPLAMAAVWKKAIGLGVPIEFLMSETMALAPWSPGPRSRTSTPRAASAYQAACHAASSGLVTGGRSSCPLPGYSLIPAPQVGPTSWAVPDQTVLDHHANIKPEPLQSAPESRQEQRGCRRGGRACACARAAPYHGTGGA